MRVFRIKCAQVRSVDPLVVRTAANTGVSLRLGGAEPAFYMEDGTVRIVVDSGEGIPSVPELEKMEDDFAPDYTQFVFQGAATAEVDDLFLVVRSSGQLFVTAGAQVLPFTESELREASDLEVACPGTEPPPHQPN